MSKKRVKTPRFGSKKLFETLKFVLRAILFAFILVNLEKIWNILTSVFTWCTKTDFGYVWVINIASGAIATGLIGLITRKSRKRYATTIRVAKIIIFVFVVLEVECIGWHLEDSWEVLKAPIDSPNIILAILGLVAAILSFIWHLRGVKYEDKYYDDDYESHYKEEPPLEETKGDSPRRRAFNWEDEG